MAAWEDLNAFADGEMTPERAAVFAETLAREPQAAQDLARILVLKRRLRGPRRQARPVLAVAVAAVALLLAWGEPLPAFDPREAHTAWAAEGQPAGLQPAALPAPPDLRAAGLTLVTLRTLSDGGGSVLHMGWHGTRGCRVSLFATEAPAAVDAEPHPDGDGWRWSIGGRTYHLLASGMAADRFAAIARAAYDALRHDAAPNAATRSLLARSRAASPPCIG